MNTSEKPKTANASAIKDAQKTEPKTAPKDFNKKGIAPAARSEGLKTYRLRFLADQLFRGKRYKQGDEIEVGEGIFKAYKRRSALKFEQNTH